MTVQIILGDCREQLKHLPDRSVHCVVTSPPYFGLRDYQTGEWVGGDPDCTHVVGEMRRGLGLAASPSATRGGAKKIAEISDIQARAECPHCGAERVDQQIGLEPSPDEFVAVMVEVFREIRRVLRDDGTVWLNLGDSYAGSRSGPDTGSTLQGSRHNQNAAKDAKRAMTASRRRDDAQVPRSDLRLPGYKPKDLLGIPWLVAFALRADGWFLRQDIIWAKPNPMPESITDRCTKAHEYVFLLAKSGKPTIWRARDTNEWSSAPDRTETLAAPTDEDPDRVVPRWRGFDYYYDQLAIGEPTSPDTHARVARGRSDHHKNADGGPGDQTIAKGKTSAGRYATPAGWDSGKGDGRHGTVHREGRTKIKSPKTVANTPGSRNNESFMNAVSGDVLTVRNKRTVWTVASEAFGEAHFATFPQALIEPCILAACPMGGTVLDPFGGAGTTGLVAEGLGRNAVLIELNPDYAAMAKRRIRAALGRVESEADDERGLDPLPLFAAGGA